MGIDLMTEPVPQQNPTHPIIPSDIINAIYGLVYHVGPPTEDSRAIGAWGETSHEALTRWMDLFSEYLHDCADAHDFQHRIWWKKPLQVSDVNVLNGSYFVSARLVVW